MPKLYKVGDKLEVMDHVTQVVQEGILICIEPDNEILDLVWFYIKSDEPKLNDKLDSRFGAYWYMCESQSEYIRKKQ
jgi:hypothetical protein